MSKLTTKHNQLSLGKHTHSSSLGQVRGNPLMPMLMEGFVAEQMVGEMGMGTAWYGQGRRSSTTGGELWSLRPPGGSTPGDALNPKS